MAELDVLDGFPNTIGEDGVEVEPEVKVKGEEGEPKVEVKAPEIKVDDKINPEVEMKAKVTKAVTEAIAAQKKVKEPKKDVKDFEQRYFDTQKYATQVNQENLQLRDTVTGLQQQVNQIINGLKDERIEIKTPVVTQQATVNPNQPTPQTDLQARITSSETLAYAMFGKAEVDAYFAGPTSKFAELLEKPGGQQMLMEVQASPMPVIEAIRRVKAAEQMVEAEKKGSSDLVNTTVAQVLKELGIGGVGGGGGKKPPVGIVGVNAVGEGNNKTHPKDFFDGFPSLTGGG